MKGHDHWRIACTAVFGRVTSPVIFCGNMLRAFGLAVTLLAITSTLLPAGELVQFDAASDDAGSLKLLGYLARPRGPQAGPSPAVVILHHCGGFDDLVVNWADRLSTWGYAALAADSFGPRKAPTNCTARTYQALDALSALDFLARQDFVDRNRIGVLGFSQGGIATLRNAEDDFPPAKSHLDKFRAAVAFYPDCASVSGIMSVPTLVLIGDLDDWTPANACQAMMEGRAVLGLSRQPGDRSMVTLITYPGVYHSFNLPLLRTVSPGVRFRDHWLEYNADADNDSIAKVKEFLQAKLRRE